MEERLTGLNIPNHVAIILDGNGRWAKKRGLPRKMGHIEGAKTLEQICEDAYNIGINYLTVYAFSTENWNRPEDEVSAIMKLLRNYMKTAVTRANKNNMKVRVIGERSRLDQDLRDSISDLEEATKDNTGLHFTIALNYGGRDEIVRAVKKAVNAVNDKTLSVDEIDEKSFGAMLDTGEYPDPDLLIRTCNELRISNFLLWQLAYTEFYFTPIPWPDFDKEELIKAVEAYNHRERRYGGVIEK